MDRNRIAAIIVALLLASLSTNAQNIIQLTPYMSFDAQSGNCIAAADATPVQTAIVQKANDEILRARFMYHESGQTTYLVSIPLFEGELEPGETVTCTLSMDGIPVFCEARIESTESICGSDSSSRIGWVGFEINGHTAYQTIPVNIGIKSRSGANRVESKKVSILFKDCNAKEAKCLYEVRTQVRIPLYNNTAN